jgi:hypothetical protein
VLRNNDGQASHVKCLRRQRPRGAMSRKTDESINLVASAVGYDASKPVRVGHRTSVDRPGRRAQLQKETLATCVRNFPASGQVAEPLHTESTKSCFQHPRQLRIAQRADTLDRLGRSAGWQPPCSH